MNRYLINLSYMGSHFSGVQKKINKAENFFGDSTTVQGALEIALRLLKPKNEINVAISSRTDKGVHALHSTVHVDLERSNGEPFRPEWITTQLNRSFQKDCLSIRILNTEHVPDTFHCRHSAIYRTYLYRVAVAKEKFDPLASSTTTYSAQRFLPIEEQNRCLFVLNKDFDIVKAKDAAKLFIGKHDFRSFMNTPKGHLEKIKYDRAFFALRDIYDFKIEPGVPMTTHFNYEQALRKYNYWDFTITGRSFLYRQVRKMVATLLYVANGTITQRDIYEMLTIPSRYSWKSSVGVIPPDGLFLVKVGYDENSKKFSESESESAIVNK